MVKDAAFTDTGTAIITAEFIAVPNLVPAFAAFDGSIDELKHHPFRSSGPPLERPALKKRFIASDSCGLARFRAAGQ